MSLNVQDYAEALRNNLYGGDLEIATLAWLFKLKVSVYSHYQWKCSGDELRPEVHVQLSEAEDPEGGEIHILFEQGMSGASDHHSLIVPSRASQCEFSLSASDDDSDSRPKNLRYEAPPPLDVAPKPRDQQYALLLKESAAPPPSVVAPKPRGQHRTLLKESATPPPSVVAPKPRGQKRALLKESAAPSALVVNPESNVSVISFQKHALMSESLPRWNIDLKVMLISRSVGRGIVAMRNFHKKEVVGIYDGHRCDDKGMVLQRHGDKLTCILC